MTPPQDIAGQPSIRTRATIRDVATGLGLSAATVSLALNGKGTISAATRDRVLHEAKRLGYQAHPFARGLRGGRSGVIALSVRSLDAAGAYRPAGVDHFNRMAGAAAFSALDRGLQLLLVPHRLGSTGQEAPRWVDGYIVEDPVANDPVITVLLDAGLPVVTIGWDPARKSRTAWVSSAAEDTGVRVLDLLAARGARRICMISGVERNSWNQGAERTYRSWSRAHGRSIELVRVAEPAGEAGGAEAAAVLLTSPTPPDAIWCQTGRHAAGAAATGLGLGLRIPEDLMIAAGTDAEQTRSFDPPITAVDLQPEMLGQQAVDLLAEILSDTATRRSRVVPGRLLERASTNRRPPITE